MVGVFLRLYKAIGGDYGYGIRDFFFGAGSDPCIYIYIYMYIYIHSG